MPVEAITAELVVRYLDTWLPGALHAGRRATFVQAWPEVIDTAEAASVLRVFGEFADRMRGKNITVVLIAPEIGEARAGLPGVPAEVTVHVLAGRAETHAAAALKAAQAAKAPLLLRLAGDTDALPAVRAATIGKPAEVLLETPAGRQPSTADLRAAGFDLVSSVELVGVEATVAVTFGTSSAKALEAFKNELWQLDEYAGVRIRDPRDADAEAMDISLHPSPGPLRREILAYLTSHGPATVTDIRRFALTDTAFRASDATAVLSALLAAGAVSRTPPSGRLAGDTVIARR